MRTDAEHAVSSQAAISVFIGNNAYLVTDSQIVNFLRTLSRTPCDQ